MPVLAIDELENISCFNPLTLPSILMFRSFGLSLPSGTFFRLTLDLWHYFFTRPIAVIVPFCHATSRRWLFLFYLSGQVVSGSSGILPAADIELDIHVVLVALNGKRHLKTTVWALKGFTAIGLITWLLPSMTLVYRIFTWSCYLTYLFLPCQQSQFSRTQRMTELSSPPLFLHTPASE